MAHEHKIVDSDVHFRIDPVTRLMTTESQKVSILQYDHNSERFTFEVPRFVEGHDMGITTSAEVHYINAQSSGGVGAVRNTGIYPMADLQVYPDDENYVIGSWLISLNATQFVGSLVFAIRFVCTDENNKIVYQWSTAPYTNIKIIEGVNNIDEMETDIEENDLLNVWKQELIDAMQPYVNTAVVSAEEAAKSADAAKQSELNAADSALAARQSELAAKVHADRANVSETNAANSAISAATSSQAAAISASAAATSAENAQLSEYRAENLNEVIISKLDETNQLVIELERKISETKFTVDFDTGLLHYISPAYMFSINHFTGNLEWEVL